MSSYHNHLAGQKSPYLLQHVQNPVDWFPWGAEALNKSQQEQKPILLSIGYSTCHWCHVMAHESFENEDIAKIINEHFIAIKVDREERPDLDQIYMTAVTTLTGQGGWPLTAFLTPEGKPFFGGTYFPPYAKYGTPGFMDLLNTIAHAWIDQREQILTSSEEITKLLLQQSQKFTQVSKVPDEGLLEIASRHISGQFDRTHGGFSYAPKFPMGHYLSFALRFYKRSKNKDFLSMVEQTLDAIAAGGIYDHLGGGFHRYSTDATWHVPHFEKMLYDQALLVKAYLEAYQLTGHLKYALIVRETLDYILRDMQQSEGGFYCAEDADSLSDSGHKVEGAFYVWSKQEILNILGVQEGEIFSYVYGVQEQGNAAHDPHGEFTGKNILFIAHSLTEAAEFFKKNVDEINDILDKAKQQLFQHRLSRSRPHLDDKLLVDWNGLMISAFSLAGVILDEPKYIEAAQKSADFIIDHLKVKNRLLHSWRLGASNILGTLEDYAFFTNGLLDLYEVSSQEKYLIHVNLLAIDMIRLFEDKEHGGFFLTGTDAETLIIRPKDIYDGAIPSGNSMAAHLLVRLSLIHSDPTWINQAETLFKIFADSLEKSPSAYTYALSALDAYLGTSIKIVLEGREDDQDLVQMRRLVYKHFIPNKSISYRKVEIQANAQLCYGQTCHKPIVQLNVLEDQLLQS